MANNRFKSAFAGLFRFFVCALMLQGAVCLQAYAQDAAPAAGKAPHKQVRVFNPRRGTPDSTRLHEPLERRTVEQSNLTHVNPGPGIVYTCDPNFATYAPAGTCDYLNTVIAGYYNSTFTNANANIYLVFGSTGLGETNSYLNYLTYDQYETAYSSIANKSAIQTSALSALGTYAATPYGSGQVGVTVSLGEALGFTAPNFTGTDPFGNACTAGTSGCYNAVTTITNDTVDTPLYYDNVGGPEPSDAYDFYSTVMHETDEVLGTSSCISTGPPLSDGCDGFGPDSSQVGTPGAVDLFRYSSAGNLVLDSSLSLTPGAYFSYDGGTTNGAKGNAGDGKFYNTLDNGDDYADFVYTDLDNCATNEAVQDAEGCPGEDAGLNILNDGGGEINILNAVGFSIPPATAPAVLNTPTPGTTLTSNTVKFTWSAGSGVSAYDLHLSAVAPGGYDLYLSGHVTSLSATVSGLPVNGEKIYARLYSIINGATQYNDYIYFAETVTISKLISPAPSTTLTGASIKFTWSAVSGVSAYDLHLSAVSPGGYDLYVSGHVTTTSATVKDIPLNGKKIYARLYSIKSGVTYYNDYTYTAASLAELLYPAPGSTLKSTSVFFEWTAGGGVSAYDLHLSAVAAGDFDLYSSGHTTSTIKTVNGLPANGEPIYARLYSIIGGVTYYNDYTYHAK
jgi:hypothetical protein